MRTRFFSWLGVAALLSVVCVVVGCNSDWDAEDNLSTGEDEQGLVFTMAEEQFGDDVEVRALAKPDVVDTVDVADGVEAEVAVERDVDEERALTRAIKTNNHYTIVAFEAGTNKEKGKITGTFNLVTGAFIPDKGRGRHIILTPNKNYHFVCYADKFITRKGNVLNVSRGNAEKALAGRTANVKILPQKRQSIAFHLERFGVRVRTKLVAPVPISTVIIAKIEASKKEIPLGLNVNMLSWDKKLEGASGVECPERRYGTTNSFVIDKKYSLNAVLSNGYDYFLAGTNSTKLNLRITHGTLYGKSLITKTPIPLSKGKSLQAAHSYVIRLTLLPKYKYLWNDGQVNYLSKRDRKKFTPIALVVDSHLAIALWDANGGQDLAWHTLNAFTISYNSRRISENTGSSIENVKRAIKDPETGKTWTYETIWNGWLNKYFVKADEAQYFPAFYHAVHFYDDLSKYRLPKGQQLAAKLKQRGPWFMASVSPWVKVYTTITFTDEKDFGSRGRWDGYLGDRAFKLAGGDNLQFNVNYWTSAEGSYEANNEDAPVERHIIWIHQPNYGVGSMFAGELGKDVKARVRPFIYF